MTTIIISVVAMVLLSAFFSGMEIAFTSKNRLKLEIDRRQSPMFDFIANLFSHNPSQYITTILVGNNIALVIYSLSMSLLIQGVARHFGWLGAEQSSSAFVDTAISTIIIIFAGEFLPKSIFKNNPNFYYRALSPLIYFFYIILYPIAKFTTLISHALLRLVGSKITPDVNPVFDRSDLASLFENPTSEKVQAESDRERDNEMKIFQNVLDFADQRVRDCMTPRVDIEAIDIENATIDDVIAKFAETKFSRLFVWRGSIDNIIGYVSSKRLFLKPTQVSDMLMPVQFVPEAMQLNTLMQTLTKHKTSIAVVIDEFGGTAGVITLEDVLEEIFGEIEDEHDVQELIEKRINDKEFVFSCRLEVEHLNENYDLQIEECEEYDTLAGFIIYHHKGIPAAGEVVNIGRFQFKILSTTRSRIELARVKIIA